MFLKKASAAKKITLKALEKNIEFLSTGNLNHIDNTKLNAEIEFLEKVVAIERFFDIAFSIPQELRAEDHSLIDQLYSMIERGVYQSRRKCFNFTLEVSELSRSSINSMSEDARFALVYTEDVTVALFGQTIKFLLLRRIDGATLDNLGELKQKIAALNDGDEIELRYVPFNQDGFMTYSDAFYSEEAKRNLLYPNTEQIENQEIIGREKTE